MTILVFSAAIALNFTKPYTPPRTLEDEALTKIQDFPIYPGSRFLKSETLICPTPNSGYPGCGHVSHTWETLFPISRVTNWYDENTKNSGWQRTGGTGSPGSFKTEIYEKNGRKVNVILSSEEKTFAFRTSISVIPLN